MQKLRQLVSRGSVAGGVFCPPPATAVAPFLTRNGGKENVPNEISPARQTFQLHIVFKAPLASRANQICPAQQWCGGRQQTALYLRERADTPLISPLLGMFFLLLKTSIKKNTPTCFQIRPSSSCVQQRVNTPLNSAGPPGPRTRHLSQRGEITRAHGCSCSAYARAQQADEFLALKKTPRAPVLSACPRTRAPGLSGGRPFCGVSKPPLALCRI